MVMTAATTGAKTEFDSMCSVRMILCLLLILPAGLIAQRGGRGGDAAPPPAGPPKNLRILPPDTNIQQTMGAFRTALGVQCTFCHVQGDFASDENPKKNMARNMLRLANDVNANFPDGKRHVTCYTCHRGEATPKMEAPAAAAPKPAPPAQ
jgi:Photosynthetic reaction centre cytochrome C subunit